MHAIHLAKSGSPEEAGRNASAGHPDPLSSCLRRLQRRLNGWELDHLRQHAAELAERLEDAERRRSYADQQADFWREQCMRLEEAITDEDSGSGRQIGLTLSGDLVVVEA